MYIPKVRLAAAAAFICVAILLAVLFWRGLKAEPSGDLLPEFTWREADEADLF
jgi:hypothetical protein